MGSRLKIMANIFTTIKNCMEKVCRSMLLEKVWIDFQSSKSVVAKFKQCGWNGQLPDRSRLVQKISAMVGTFFYVVQRFVSSSKKIWTVLHENQDTIAYEKFQSRCTKRDIDGIPIEYPGLGAITDSFGSVKDLQNQLETLTKPTIHKVLIFMPNWYEELEKSQMAGPNGVESGEAMLSLHCNLWRCAAKWIHRCTERPKFMIWC